MPHGVGLEQQLLTVLGTEGLAQGGSVPMRIFDNSWGDIFGSFDWEVLVDRG